MAADLVRFSYSEVETARQCPHKWWLSYGLGWRARARGARAIGQMWHKLMQEHYLGIQNGFDLASVREMVLDRLQVVCYPEGADTNIADEQYELLLWMYEGHVEAYGTDPDWQILEVEEKAVVPVFDTGFEMAFVIDLLVMDRKTGRRWLVDHKTSGKTPKRQDFDLNDQFPLYAWGMAQLGHNIAGCIRSQVLTRKNKSKPQAIEDRFARFNLHHTPKEQNGALGDAIRTIQNVRAWPAGEHPRFLDMETCAYRCDFREACLIGRKSGPPAEQAVLLGSGMSARRTPDLPPPSA